MIMCWFVFGLWSAGWVLHLLDKYGFIVIDEDSPRHKNKKGGGK